MSKLKLIGDRILLKKRMKEEKKGFIYIDQEQRFDWEVEESYEGCEAKKGSLVLIERYKGQEVEFDNEKYLIVKSDDLIGIIEPTTLPHR